MRLGFSYREQIAAWNEIHSTFARNFDVKGPSPFAAFSEAHQEGSALFPVIWDLDVDEDRVYVLWAQGGDERGFRVDVFDAGDGELTGYFYTQTPSDEKNMFIEADGNDFYTLDYSYGIVYKYRMYPL